MSRRSRLSFVPAAIVGVAAAVQPAPTEPAEVIDPRWVTARAISEEFAAELRAALEKAMTDKGPAAAIAVCRDEAPRIAARLSAGSGTSVSRTGLRVRNPGNTPQPWQRTVLDTFEIRLAAGAKPAELEYFEIHADGSARYLRAIVTQPLCLVCHGEAIAPALEEALEEYYPQDQARGFKVGDLRGAVSIEWPARKDAAP